MYEPIRRTPEKKVSSKSITKSSQIPVVKKKSTFGPENPGTIGIKMESKPRSSTGGMMVKKTLPRKTRP